MSDIINKDISVLKKELKEKIENKEKLSAIDIDMIINLFSKELFSKEEMEKLDEDVKRNLSNRIAITRSIIACAEMIENFNQISFFIKDTLNNSIVSSENNSYISLLKGLDIFIHNFTSTFNEISENKTDNLYYSKF